mgnify:CR=1 FL=1
MSAAGWTGRAGAKPGAMFRAGSANGLKSCLAARIWQQLRAKGCARTDRQAPKRARFTGITNMANPLQFLQQVRSEAGKVTWPSRREVMLTTGMVLAMAALTSLFFSLVDWVIRLGVAAVLGN